MGQELIYRVLPQGFSFKYGRNKYTVEGMEKGFYKIVDGQDNVWFVEHLDLCEFLDATEQYPHPPSYKKCPRNQYLPVSFLYNKIALPCNSKKEAMKQARKIKGELVNPNILSFDFFLNSEIKKRVPAYEVVGM